MLLTDLYIDTQLFNADIALDTHLIGHQPCYGNPFTGIIIDAIYYGHPVTNTGMSYNGIPHNANT